MQFNNSSIETCASGERSELLGSRHPLTGQVTVQPQPDMQAYDAFLREIVQGLNPRTALERQLAQFYATCQWRLNRASAIEENLFSIGNMEEIADNLNFEHPEIHNAATNAKTFRDEARTFVQLALYSQRLMTQAETVLKRLLKVQAERARGEQEQLIEAANLYRLHAMQNLAFDPKTHGYPLNTTEIAEFVRRTDLKIQAARAEQAGWQLPQLPAATNAA